MADNVYNIAKAGLMDGTIDLDTHTINVFPCMTNTTADTEIDPDTLTGTNPITTIDEYDGSGFTWGHGNTGRKTIGSISVTADDTDDEGVFDSSADITWASLGAGTRGAQGFLMIKEGAADDTTAIPIAWFDGVFTGNGGDVTLQWNAEGILNMN
jgi:hypothetical protein